VGRYSPALPGKVDGGELPYWSEQDSKKPSLRAGGEGRAVFPKLGGGGGLVMPKIDLAKTRELEHEQTETQKRMEKLKRCVLLACCLRVACVLLACC